MDMIRSCCGYSHRNDRNRRRMQGTRLCRLLCDDHIRVLCI